MGVRVVLGYPLGEGTVRRLGALSPDLVVEEVPSERDALRALADPDVEVLVAGVAPADLARTPKLRWLQVPSAGVDHFLDDPPWRRGLTVTNGRGVYAIPIAEYILGAILRTHQPWEAWATGQAERHWPADDEQRLADLVRERVAVIVGYGSIGRETARLLRAVGMRIVAVKNRSDDRVDHGFRVPGTGDPDGSIPDAILPIDRLAEAAAEADYLILTLPLTARSRNLVDRDVLAALPRHARLINISRGGLIDDDALLDALRTGRIAGAVLDVFRTEPLPPDAPFWDAPNAIVTPHVAGATSRFLVDLVEENLRRYLAGEPLLNVVDPELEY